MTRFDWIMITLCCIPGAIVLYFIIMMVCVFIPYQGGM